MFAGIEYPHRFSAVVSLQEFLQRYADDRRVSAAQFMLARAYEGQSDWRNTIAAYRSYLRMDKALAMDAYDGIGKAAMLISDYEQAASTYAEGLRAATDKSWIVYMRGGIDEVTAASKK